MVTYSQANRYKRRIYTNQFYDLTEAGHLQIESNIIYEDNYVGGYNLYATDNRFRYGINTDTEIFLDVDLFYNHIQGFGLLPTSLGLKMNLSEERKFIPDIAFISSVQIGQLGSGQYRFKNPVPTLGIIFEEQFTKDIYGELDCLMQWVDDGTTIPTYLFDYVMTFQLPKGFSIFPGVVYNIIPKNNDSSLLVETGIAKDLKHSWSISLEMGKFFGNSEQDFYLGFGFSKDINLKKQKKQVKPTN